MKHSIVLWDCTFRNFFHLLDSLAQQAYDLGEVEVIVVEQRSRELAEGYARQEGVRSAWEVADDVADRLNVRILALDESMSTPYHPGRLLNVGLQEATGEILSTMDADLLVPAGFLSLLERMHERGQRVITLHRHQAAYPCGTTVDDWKHQIIDYDLILPTCPDAGVPIPQVNQNKAPLLSARRETWDAIEGYDEHVLFSTAYTCFGRDASVRFNVALGGGQEIPMPIACVHPWHPTEVQRNDMKIRCLYQAQNFAMKWSHTQQAPRVSQRNGYLQNLYGNNAVAIDGAIQYAEQHMVATTHGRPVETVLAID
jgi:hypothetical protein